ncbi:UPF0039 protein YybD [Smittium mucronatum]|uniref:UPF0039 protein YybD n=1 Tax=Smittium mucronatum TaxID=133383 RepID=A0A1R0GWW1_9FUNG|nr:UPF0039 protein YybD [Smittium mucronatum]
MSDIRKSLKLILAKTQEELDQGAKVRSIVLTTEMGFDVASQIDEKDSISKYVLATITTPENKTIPIGSLRLYRYSPKVVKIGRVAVLKDYRSLGVGKEMMLFAEDFIWNYDEYAGVEEIGLNSVFEKQEFYKKLGYHTVGDMFLEENHPHIYMARHRPLHPY